MAPPLVSVIIVNYNRKDYLAECVASVLAQDYAPLEIIVVDNGSTDGSREYLESRKDSVKALFLDRNTGFTGGNIAGLGEASGSYLALLNNDAVLSTDWVRHHVQAMEENPAAGLTASKVARFDHPDTLDCAGDGITTSMRGFKLCEGHPTSSQSEPRWVFSSSAAASMIRRDMIDAVGFLDPLFFFNCEDTDLCFRAQLMGWRCLYVPGGLVRHRVHGSYSLLGGKAIRYWSRNIELMWIKNMPARLIFRYFHHHVIHEFAALAKNLHHPRYTFNVISGKLAVLPHVPYALRERGRIQATRKVSDAYIDASLTPFFSKEYRGRRVTILRE